MNNTSALALERPRFIQNFKGGFCAQPRHAPGKLQFVLDLAGSLHGKNSSAGKRDIITPSFYRNRMEHLRYTHSVFCGSILTAYLDELYRPAARWS
jgi:hypothetical protein